MAEWLEIDNEEEPDVEEIMRQIRAHLAQRRREEAFSDLDDGEIQNLSGDVFSDVVYEELIEASQRSRRTAVSLDVRSSSVPLIGPLLDGVRTKLHEAIVFYVNKAATQQAAVNTHLVRALVALVSDLEQREATQADIEALRAEVAILAERLDVDGAS